MVHGNWNDSNFDFKINYRLLVMCTGEPQQTLVCCRRGLTLDFSSSPTLFRVQAHIFIACQLLLLIFLTGYAFIVKITSIFRPWLCLSLALWKDIAIFKAVKFRLHWSMNIMLHTNNVRLVPRSRWRCLDGQRHRDVDVMFA